VESLPYWLARYVDAAGAAVADTSIARSTAMNATTTAMSESPVRSQSRREVSLRIV
jgi:hypothetical protein